MHSNLIFTVLDVAINLIVALFGMGGLLYLESGLSSATPAAASSALSDEELDHRLGQASRANEDLRPQIATAAQQADNRLATLERRIKNRPDLPGSRHARDRIVHEVRTSRDEASRLDEDLRRLLLIAGEVEREERKDATSSRKADELKARLVEKLHRVDAAREEIARIQHEEIRRPIIRTDIAPRFSTDTRQPVFVLVNRGTVTPIRPPYYAVEDRENRIVARLVSRGETLDRALKAGSAFRSLVDQVDPQKQYIFLLVDSASFEAFLRTREWLQQHNIACGWDTCNTTTIVGSNNSDAVRPGVSN